MVFPDINSTKSFHEVKRSGKVPFYVRFFSFIIDYFIFTPVVSFLIMILLKSGVEIYKTYPNSEEASLVVFYLGIAFIVLTTFLQALFITYYGATPGQYFLKLKISFNDKQSPIFLQAWLRQIGFFSSFAFLGLPFLKVFSDENGRCFYEKITDSNLESKVIFYKTLDVFSRDHELDKKFWKASLSTLSCFLVFFGIIFYFKSYQNILTSPLSYAKFKSKSLDCQDFANLDSAERLRFGIAMNLIGTYSDECLNREADFTLWRNFTEDKSLAYFAKFLTTEKNTPTEAAYLRESCTQYPESEGCYYATKFSKNDFKKISEDKTYGSTILAYILEYETQEDTLSKDDKKYIFNEIKNFSSYKPIKKYLINKSIQKISNTEANQNRIPASVEKLNKKDAGENMSVEQVLELVNEL
ncbi:MAG: RDD family protein [Pseudobdellovibrio sp.]